MINKERLKLIICAESDCNEKRSDLKSFLKVSCHTKFRFAERKAQCILGECGPLKNKVNENK